MDLVQASALLKSDICRGHDFLTAPACHHIFSGQCSEEVGSSKISECSYAIRSGSCSRWSFETGMHGRDTVRIGRLEVWPASIAFPYGKSHCKGCKHLRQWDLREAIQGCNSGNFDFWSLCPWQYVPWLRESHWGKLYLCDISLFWWTSTLLKASICRISIAQTPAAAGQVPLQEIASFSAAVLSQTPWEVQLFPCFSQEPGLYKCTG